MYSHVSPASESPTCQTCRLLQVNCFVVTMDSNTNQPAIQIGLDPSAKQDQLVLPAELAGATRPQSALVDSQPGSYEPLMNSYECRNCLLEMIRMNG